MCFCLCVCVCVCVRSEEHTSELQSHLNLVCRLLLEKKTAALCAWAGVCACVWLSRATWSRLSLVRDVIVHRLRARLSASVYKIALLFFFFNDTATTEIYTLSLHDALPI